MGTFGSGDGSTFVEYVSAFVDGTNVPDRPGDGDTTLTFREWATGLPTSPATQTVERGGHWGPVTVTLADSGASVDLLDVSADGGSTWLIAPLQSAELKASGGAAAIDTSSAVAAANAAAAQALQAVSDAADATQAANAAAQTAQTAAQTAQQVSASSAYFTVTMASGSYPARGRTTGVCNWRGPTKPPITTGYAQAGDEWTRTAS